MLMILLLIFPASGDPSQDYEHDQDQEQEVRQIPHCQRRGFVE
jgi:hypothetical protein